MTETDVKVLNEILTEKQKEIAPELNESEFFEFFSAQEILRNYSLSPNEIQNGIVGGGNGGTDGGIDSIYLLVGGRYVSDTEAAEDLKALKQSVVIDLILIQSSREETFSMDRVLRMGETSENILSLGRGPTEFTEKYNDSLLDAIERFRTGHRVLVGKFPTLNLSFFYVTKGQTTKISDDVKKKATGVEGKAKALLATVTKSTFTFVGARELIELAIKPPKKTTPLPYIGLMDSPKGGYAAFVKLSAFYDFITDRDEMIDHLFDFNVRDYQGDVEVNKGIRDTLAKAVANEDFWWLNNGITELDPVLRTV